MRTVVHNHIHRPVRDGRIIPSEEEHRVFQAKMAEVDRLLAKASSDLERARGKPLSSTELAEIKAVVRSKGPSFLETLGQSLLWPIVWFVIGSSMDASAGDADLCAEEYLRGLAHGGTMQAHARQNRQGQRDAQPDDRAQRYVAMLTSNLGKAQEFLAVMQSLENEDQGVVAQVANQFVGAPLSSSKTAALKGIRGREMNLQTAMAKSRATGGRSAG